MEIWEAWLQAVLPESQSGGLDVLEVQRAFRQIARLAGRRRKGAVLRDLLSRATPLEAKYIIKIITGDLRIGLKESLVEEAIAKAYGSPSADVQRANMLLGDIGETLKLAPKDRLGEAKMRLFHPLGFMLASPIESAEEGLSYFAEAAVEDKYDGIRAQAHVSRRRGADLLAHARRHYRIVSGVAAGAGGTAAGCDSGWGDRGLGVSGETGSGEGDRG